MSGALPFSSSTTSAASCASCGASTQSRRSGQRRQRRAAVSSTGVCGVRLPYIKRAVRGGRRQGYVHMDVLTDDPQASWRRPSWRLRRGAKGPCRGRGAFCSPPRSPRAAGAAAAAVAAAERPRRRRSGLRGRSTVCPPAGCGRWRRRPPRGAPKGSGPWTGCARRSSTTLRRNGCVYVRLYVYVRLLMYGVVGLCM